MMPRQLGEGFGRLWTASTVGNLGDGVGRIAIALFAVQLTRDPLAVAAITALSYLPWLVVGMPAGVLADRWDRRRMAAIAGGVRAATVGILVVAAATDRASLWLLYGVVVALYTCESFYDNAVVSMVPMVVSDPGDLERANGRLQGARLAADSFAGPPLASAVFALGATYAVGIHMACYAVAALLLLTMRGSYRAGGREAVRAAPSLRGELVEGWRYVWGHATHRVLLGLLMALGFGSAMVNATNVLWTLEVLGVSEALFGVFTLTLATGALVGSQSAAAVAGRLGRGRAMSVALLGSATGALVAAATTSPYVAGVGLVMVGWSVLVLNVVNAALRQRLTPATMLGRVTGIYHSAAVGVMVAGAAVGGALASAGGLRLPWLGFGVGALLLAAFVFRRLPNEVIDRALVDAAAVAESTPPARA